MKRGGNKTHIPGPFLSIALANEISKLFFFDFLESLLHFEPEL